MTMTLRNCRFLGKFRWIVLCLVMVQFNSASGVAQKKKETKGKSIDLLKILGRGGRAAVQLKGKWRLEKGVLISPQLPVAKIQLPYTPPDEYDLTMTVEQTGPDEALALGILVRGHRSSVFFDWHPRTTRRILSGISLLDESNDRNESITFGRHLVTDRESVVLVSVRNDGETKSSITASVDGKKVVDWTGDPRRLSPSPSYFTPNKNALWISCNTSYLIKKYELTPISGRGRVLR